MGFGLLQTANHTADMADRSVEQRGVISALLNLSRNLGLITGAVLVGAVFAFAIGASDLAAASPVAVATGMRTTFAVADAWLAIALVVAVGGGRRGAGRAVDGA